MALELMAFKDASLHLRTDYLLFTVEASFNLEPEYDTADCDYPSEQTSIYEIK